MGLSSKSQLNEFSETYLAPETPLHGTPHAPKSKIADSSTSSAVSWGAIFAGAIAAAALALILLLLGVGLGLSSISPWAYKGFSTSPIGISAILWLSFTQVAAYGMGGYLAGRLRTKWITAHSDEVYFRDTAHGFLSWAVASLVAAVLLTSVIGSIIGTGVKSATVMTGALSNNTEIENSNNLIPNPITDQIDYFTSSLLRKNINGSTVSETNINVVNNAKSEIAIIFMNAIRNGDMSTSDVDYASQLVSERTGLPELEAKKRVNNTFSKLQTKLRNAEQFTNKATDTARKSSAYAALWLFISLLMGAFAASYAATCGGRNRDT